MVSSLAFDIYTHNNIKRHQYVDVRYLYRLDGVDEVLSRLYFVFGFVG